ncbi:MAG: YncE family protein [Ignavibacteriales bacterium]|nr:YncE family protein [Ignavibacteriales bacterium]
MTTHRRYGCQRRFVTLALMIAVLVGSITAHAQTKSGYHVAKKIKVGGEGGWDYLTFDARTHRLFVSHADRFVVIDAKTDQVTGEILKLEGVHGMAIAHEFNRGFITNGTSSTVSVVDMKTLQVTGTIPVGKKPDAILYDAFSHRVFVYNGQSENASVIDAEKGTVISTIALGGKPEFSATDGKGHIFVNLEDKNEVVAFNASTLKIFGRWPLKGGDEPTGLAIDVEHHRLFSVCHNKLMFVLDSDNGTVIATLPIGAKVDGCAFDPGTGLVFTSNGEGTMTVIREESPSKFSVLETVATQLGAKTITVDPETHTLYLPTAEFGPAPAPTAQVPAPRGPILPNTFVVLKVTK